MPAMGQGTYRCMGADGRIAYQDRPCAAQETSRATATTCTAHPPDSDAQVRCLARQTCEGNGAIGATRDACVREREAALFVDLARRQKIQAELAALKRASAERQKAESDRKAYVAEVKRRPQPADDPLTVFVEGSRWESDALAKTVDGYGDRVRYYPNQSFTIFYRGEYVRVQTRKLNETGIPAIYEVVSAGVEHGLRPDAAPSSNTRSKVSCSDLSRYAEAKGQGFFERALIVDNARRRGDCE